jgi:hypothetical protein
MTLGKTGRLHAARMASEVLLRIILTERDREIAGPGWCVCADGLGGRQRAMETAQQWDRLAPAEIAMFQISEVQESPAFNGRRSFLTLRGPPFFNSRAATSSRR